MLPQDAVPVVRQLRKQRAIPALHIKGPTCTTRLTSCTVGPQRTKCHSSIGRTLVCNDRMPQFDASPPASGEELPNRAFQRGSIGNYAKYCLTHASDGATRFYGGKSGLTISRTFQCSGSNAGFSPSLHRRFPLGIRGGTTR